MFNFKKNNIQDANSQVIAKANEIEDKGLSKFYGDPYAKEVAFEYGENPDSISKKMCALLKSSYSPKYVKLAFFIEEIENKRINVEYEKAKVMLSDTINQEPYMRSNITIAQEFNQIKERNAKELKNRSKKLNKYKEIRKFINLDMFRVYEASQAEGIKEYSSSAIITEFLDSRDELKFLNDSKLTRHL